jgi:2-polyprenyl-3-methyl-5-hydroxy-6-metoxy-1,4-benzoquinol methylase
MPTFMDADYATVAEANRRFYGGIADLYDSTETCVTSPGAQAELERDLDRVLALLAKPAAEVAALDACGGSGNVSLKLLRRGVRVTVADISPELLAILRRKADAAGLAPEEIHCGELGVFLRETDRDFDLITFSSALHHLQDIEGVLRLALARLRPGGLLFTLHDPTAKARQKALTRAVLRAEYYAFKVFCQPGDLPAAIGRKLRRARGTKPVPSPGQIAEEQLGVLAEYHVARGIDDVALVERLQTAGFEVVEHERFASARFPPVRWLVARLGDATSFKLLLRRPAGPGGG